MRILFFSDNFKPEPCPPAAHVYERARIWARLGHQVTVITTAPNFPEGKVYEGYKNQYCAEEIEGIRVIRVKTFVARNEGTLLRSLDILSFVFPAVLAGLGEARPDVIVSTSPQPCAPMAGIILSKLRRVPHVFELRDLWPASIIATTSLKRGRFYNLLEKGELFLYRNSTRISSVTRSFVADLVKRGVPDDKIDVVINGTNLELFSPRERDAEVLREFGLDGRFVVGYLGTLGAAHGLENVLDAAEKLSASNVTFFFVGVGASKEKLQRLVEERGISNVVFAGRQIREEMPRYWSVCDAALVHLRNAELFSTVIPSKIFEAMAMGLPLLFVGPRGEGAEVVERHEAGLALPPADPVALADAVARLASDPSYRDRLAANASIAAPAYSRAKQAEDTLKVLNSAIEEREAQCNALTPSKRVFDLFGSLFGLALCLPIFLLVGFAIKLDDGGPVFFRQERMGLKGRRFWIWKFRSMSSSVEKAGGAPIDVAPVGDMRVTRVGGFLRRTKLDELPQFFNVLSGEMSLVGPRPHIPAQIRHLPDDCRPMLDLLPGMTCHASIRYRNENVLLTMVEDPEHVLIHRILPHKAKLCIDYARRASMWSDLSLIVATLVALILPENLIGGLEKRLFSRLPPNLARDPVSVIRQSSRTAAE